MKLIVITNGDAPEMRDALELADNVQGDGFDIEKVDWESEDAESIARLYDIYSQPAFIVVKDDGAEIGKWQGSQLPLASDIEFLM